MHDQLKKQLQDACEHFRAEIAGLRTGRATPALRIRELAIHPNHPRLLFAILGK